MADPKADAASRALADRAAMNLMALRDGKPTIALATVDQALLAEPDHVQALTVNGEVQGFIGRQGEADAHFRRARELDPALEKHVRALAKR